MHFSKRQLYSLLALPVLICVCIGGYFVYCNAIKTPSVKAQQAAVIPDTASDFEHGEYYFNHGQYADGTYDLVKAQHYFEQAIAVNPTEDKLLWYQSGRIDFLNGNFDIALGKFQKQIDYFGDSVPNVYYMIGLTYGYKARKSGDASDWQKAEEGFTKAITFFPTAPWPYVDLSWLYFSQGKYEQMKPLLLQGMSHASDNPWLLNMYGLALLNTGDKKMAHAYFQLAAENAAKLTVSDWGKSYPGNSPEIWGAGLDEFRALINKNIALSK